MIARYQIKLELERLYNIEQKLYIDGRLRESRIERNFEHSKNNIVKHT